MKHIIKPKHALATLLALIFPFMLMASSHDLTKSKGTDQSVIVSLTPAPAQENVLSTTPIKVAFTVPLDVKHIKKHNVKLRCLTCKKKRGKRKKIKGSVHYEATENAVVFVPEDELVPGTYEVTFKSLKTAKDHKKSKIKKIKYRFRVIENGTSPVITLNGDATMTLVQDEAYTELGATAVDDVDGNTPVSISGSVDTSTVGVYTVTYTATDSAGNSASTDRTVTVIMAPDTTPPVITLNGDESITIVQGGTYSEPGATAKDERDGSVAVTISGTVDTGTVGNYTITYSASDSAGNEATATRTVHVVLPPDTTPPIITLNGDAVMTLTVDDSYTDAGASASDDTDGTITANIVTVNPVDTTIAGTYTVTYNVSDAAGNQANEVSRTITVNEVADTTPPVITLNGDAVMTLTVDDTYTEPGAVAHDDRDGSVTVTTSGSVDTATDGTYTITYSATDNAGNSAIATRTVTVEEPPVIVLQSLSVSPSPIELSIGTTIQVSIQGHYSDGHTEPVTEGLSYDLDDYTIASVNGTGTLEGLEVGTTTLHVSVGGITSAPIEVTVGGELNTDNFDFRHFGHRYLDRIPADATMDEYDEKRFCMIAGQILAEDGSPLPGVKVSLHKHPEYGTTVTDSNGTYTIPAEGGTQLTMRYTKQGYTTIDRKIQAPVQDWVRTEDVTMLAVDTKVTRIDLNNTTPQLHSSTPVTDDRGERATTLVFDGVSSATVTASDGSTRELTSLNVRATEFKTPESMPSDLPKESAYTYCSDLQVDGVNDDESITFDAPVVMYVDNFLGFEVGEIVPVGYYDRKAGEWKASENGVVVKLLDTDGDGRVDALDSNGSDTPNDLDGDGSFEDEVAGIQDNANYTAGKTYWRAAMMHFTPWDHNWPYGPPLDAAKPKQDKPKTDDDEPNDCQIDIDSYVTTKSRVFHEDIPVVGTDITLHYASNRVDGHKNIIDASINTLNLPDSVQQVKITLDIRGKRFTKYPNLNELKTLSFEWDGKDVLGNKVLRASTAKITISYAYQVVYFRASGSLERAWAQFGTNATGVRGQNRTWISQSHLVELNPYASTVANGWTFSNQHFLAGTKINSGHGETKDYVTRNIISTIAGTGQAFYSGENIDATQASLDYPESVVVDSVGNIFIADRGVNRIRKINTNGKISTFLNIDNPDIINIDSEGNIYFVHGYITRQMLKKIDNEGSIITLLGNGASRLHINSFDFDSDNNIYFSDGGILKKLDKNGAQTIVYNNRFLLVNYIAIDKKDNIYFSGGFKVQKIDSQGALSTVAGNGIRGDFGDGGQATQALLYSVNGLALDSQDNIYIADNHRIKRVDSRSGIITTIAGTGDQGFFGDGQDALKASFHYPSDLAFDTLDNLYIVDASNFRIRMISATSQFSSYTASIFYYIYQNNTADLFSIAGKHLKTIDLNTGSSLKEFTYDENNHLASITDNFSQTTIITRDSQGNPTQITAPNGQVTNLTVDANGNLTEVSYEDNSKYEFTYFDGSLMDIMTDPNGNQIQHKWNDTGRLIEEIDAAGGSYKFLRSVTGDETLYTKILPEGETSTSKDTQLDNGDTESLITLATGDTVTATFVADEKSTSSTRDGVSTNYTYTSDTLTYQKILESQEVTQPSGLKSTTSYTTAYDGNETHTNTKTQTITNNSKTITLITDYNTGTSTITTPTGRTATREYDVNTRLTQSIQSGTLTPTTYSYDNKGRVITETTGSRVTSYTYDTRGNLATVTDPRGKVTTYTYSIMDRVSTVTYPDGTTEAFTYDNNGNLLKRIVPTPADHTFAYSGVNSRTDYTSPLQKATTYTYNKSKQVTQITRPSGKAITNTYTQGRLVTTTTPEGTTNYSYLFADKVGSITHASTGSATGESFSFTYDGTLPTGITQAGVLNQAIGFTYNNDFRVTGTTYAGATENYTYDSDSLLTGSGAYTLTRDAQNAYTTQVTDGTLTQNRSYNNFGEITEIDDGTFKYELIARDDAGTITQKKETINGATVTYDYTFDDMGRLTQVQKDNTTVETYTYDNNGNRASATVNGTNITASYTLDDNLVVYGDNSYLYNDDGYLQTKTTPEGSTAYAYGTMGELLSVTTPTQSITYQHNANNQRVAKLASGTVVEKYLWANLTTLLAIYDGSDNLLQRFEYADQRMPIVMTQGSDKYYLHYDQVGSLRAVSNSSGTIVKEIVYDTYGNILSDSNPGMKVPFGFAGGLYDGDTKLTRFGYRDYNAYTGKWTAKDPIGFAGGDSNLYGYVLGDPVNFVDPWGLSSLASCVASCISDQLGFTDALALGAGVSGLPFIKKPIGGKYSGATDKTSPLSKAFGNSERTMPKNPFRGGGSRQWLAPTWKNWGSRTGKVGRFLTRWIPGIGWSILAWDTMQIGICVNKCRNNICD